MALWLCRLLVHHLWLRADGSVYCYDHGRVVAVARAR